MRVWAILGLCLALCSAKVTSGTFYKDNYQWVLIDTFLVDYKGGELQIENVDMVEAYPNQVLAIYHDIDDEDGGFRQLYKSHMSCQAKVDKAAKVVPLNHTKLATGQFLKYNFKTVMARKWFLVLANCDIKVNGPEGVGLRDIKITWTNGKVDDTETSRFLHHFSKDETGIYEMMIVSLISLLFLICLCGYFFNKLRKDETDLAHNVLLVVLIAMAFHMLAVIMHIAHRDAYAADGIGKVGVDDFGLALEQIPQLLLVALFICVGKGLYISTQTIKDVRSVVEVMVLYLIASIVLLYWSYTQENIAASEYAYLTAPGMCIIVLRLVTLLWFLSCFQATWRQERMQYKRNFYLGFGLFGAMFFLALPIIALVAAKVRHYNMTNTVTIMEQIYLLASYHVWIGLFCVNRSFFRKSSDAPDAGFQDIGMSAPQHESEI